MNPDLYLDLCLWAAEEARDRLSPFELRKKGWHLLPGGYAW